MVILRKLLLSALAAGAVGVTGYLYTTVHHPVAIHKVKPTYFDWQVLVEGVDTKKCGGVIVEEYWVLTAAHCVWKSKDQGINVWVQAGVKEQTLAARIKVACTAAKCDDIHIHPGYVYPGSDTTLVNYDIALLYVPKLTLDSSKEKIPLGEAVHEEVADAFVAGWTCMSPIDNLKSKALKSAGCDRAMVYTDVPVDERANCDKLYCPERFICAGAKSEIIAGIDPGDSGSGLTTATKGSARLIGIANQIRKLGDPYARVSLYEPWIRATLAREEFNFVENNSCPPSDEVVVESAE